MILFVFYFRFVMQQQKHKTNHRQISSHIPAELSLWRKRHTTENKTQTMTTGREGKEKRRHKLSGGGWADHVTEWNKSLTAANTHTTLFSVQWAQMKSSLKNVPASSNHSPKKPYLKIVCDISAFLHGYLMENEKYLTLYSSLVPNLFCFLLQKIA